MWRVVLTSLSFHLTLGSLQSIHPVDPDADSSAICLYRALYNLSYSSSSIIFGHHETNVNGQNFYDTTGTRNESDVLTGVGQYPGFYEYNLDKLISKNMNFTNHIISAVRRGGMVGFHWEATNPSTNGTDKDKTGNPVQNLMPGMPANGVWTSFLDKIASFISDMNIALKQEIPNADFKTIPFLFRLFHECLGSWFWWGADYCTPQQYKAAFNYTRWYLVEKKKLHNLLFVYAPNSPSEYYNNETNVTYDERYPGDEIVDIIAFDHYGQNNIKGELTKDLEIVIEFGKQVSKPTAIAEFGVSNGIQDTNDSMWFINSVYDPIWGKNDTYKNGETGKLVHKDPNYKYYQVGYMNTWANFNSDEYWVPLPGQLTFDSFNQFFNKPEPLFQKNMPTLFTC